VEWTELPTKTKEQKERERKERQKERKRATIRSALKEAPARVDIAGASLGTLNALESAMLSAKLVLMHGAASCSATEAPSLSASDLPELLRQAEEKALLLRSEVGENCAAENGNTCVVCLEAPKNSLLLPCKHVSMCAECTKAVFTSSSQPQCPVCRSRIVDCVYNMYL
jgi:hypothetical protein